MDLIDVTTPDDPRLDPFRLIKGKSDRGDGMFVAESEIVLDRLLESRFRIRSVLLTPAVREVLSVTGALDSRSAFGGTAPVRVAEQLDGLDALLASQRSRWSDGA